MTFGFASLSDSLSKGGLGANSLLKELTPVYKGGKEK